MVSKKLYKKGKLTDAQLEIRDLAMDSLKAFVGLVAPHLHIGHCHYDLLSFFEGEEERKLCIWPRGHLKSTVLAYKTAWQVINEPDTTIAYITATGDLAEKQVGLIKSILDSDIVRKYWPELLPEEEGKRELWRTAEFNIGHWKRREEFIRDPTVKAAGITGNLIGFHAQHLKLDDLVTADNSSTKTGRDEINSRYSLLSSILNAGGTIEAVGTRYHPEDLYGELIEMEEEIYDDATGDVIDTISSYKVTQEVVEVDGQFLWPRTRRKDGKWFGFNKSELSKKKADYLDKAKFFAQYYNDPSDPGNQRISNFNYYDRDRLHKDMGVWHFQGKRLNIYAAIDFAATIKKRSDYTAIVVVGIDSDGLIYILDIARFKTEKISVMADELNKLYDKWQWLKLQAEANAQQNLVIQQIKEFNRKSGIYYSIIEKPSTMKDKDVRIMATLEPRYEAGAILHYRGGNCQILEDELIATKPPHDDVSDALAAVCEIVVTPRKKNRGTNVVNVNFNSRFGGVMA
jgi:phage terminase large subunit-like protein